ncbi:NADPH:quinone reductase, partial [Streptomyces olivaceus]
MVGTVPDVMRAAYIDSVGPADRIRHGELPVPPVGPTDVLVRVAAVAANPVDTFVRWGGGAQPQDLPDGGGPPQVGGVGRGGGGDGPALE